LLEFPSDATLGGTTVNVGVIRGGHAPNVIPDLAEAEILLRTVAPSATYVEVLKEWASARGNLEIRATSEPQEMASVPGFPTKVVGYGTDVPALRALGRPLLVGPGSILVAHTADERVSKAELQDGVRLYQDLVRRLRAEAMRPSQQVKP
jgi:acetylornithine deacetylase